MSGLVERAPRASSRPRMCLLVVAFSVACSMLSDGLLFSFAIRKCHACICDGKQEISWKINKGKEIKVFEIMGSHYEGIGRDKRMKG